MTDQLDPKQKAADRQRASQLIKEMDDKTAKFFLTKTPSAKTTKDFIAEIEQCRDHLNGNCGGKSNGTKTSRTPSDGHADATRSSNEEKGTDESESEASITDSANHSNNPNDFVSFPPSIGNLRPTQIVNRGGTININYSIYQILDSTDDKKRESEIDQTSNDEAQGHVSMLTPNCIYPPSPIISPKKSAEQDGAALDGIKGGYTQSRNPADKTPSWGISDIEKGKLKDSVNLIMMGNPSRKEVVRKMKALAEATKTERWDDRQNAYVPIQLGPDSSTASVAPSGGLVSPSPVKPKTTSTAEPVITEEQVSNHGGGWDFTENSLLGNGSFQSDHSHYRTDAPPKNQGVHSGENNSSQDGARSDTPSTGTVVRHRRAAQSGSVPELHRWDAGTMTKGTSSMEQMQNQDSVSDDLPSEDDESREGFDDSCKPDTASGTSAPENHENTRGLNPVLAKPTDTLKGRLRGPSKEVKFDLAGADETKGPRGVSPINQFAAPKATLKESSPRDEPTETVGIACLGQTSTTAPTVFGASTFGRNLRPRPTKSGPDDVKPKDTMPDHNPKQKPSAARKAAKPDGKSNAPQSDHTINVGLKDPSQDRATDNKVENPQPKKPVAAAEAKTCKRGTDTPASVCPSDACAAFLAHLTAVRAMDAQRSRDSTSRVPSAAKPLKCRLCRNEFSDKTNVRQDDGEAPCSFHPGTLEETDYHNTGYVFSCCGGPPVMVGRTLIGMNLISPGCTKCYHQDKDSAWDLNTLTMETPVLFEG